MILKDGHNGYMDRRGNIVIQPRFESWERNFAEGRAVYGVSPTPFDIDHTKFGYIDEQGQSVVPAQFDDAQDFSEGLAAIAFNDGKMSKHAFRRPRRWGYIDRDGKMVITSQFRVARPFSGGLAAVQNLQAKWGYINPSGKIKVPFQFEDAASFSEGKAAVQTAEKFGFIDRHSRYDFARYHSVDPKFVGRFDVRNQRILFPHSQYDSGWCIVRHYIPRAKND